MARASLRWALVRQPQVGGASSSVEIETGGKEIAPSPSSTNLTSRPSFHRVCVVRLPLSGGPTTPAPSYWPQSRRGPHSRWGVPPWLNAVNNGTSSQVHETLADGATFKGHKAKGQRQGFWRLLLPAGRQPPEVRGGLEQQCLARPRRTVPPRRLLLRRPVGQRGLAGPWHVDQRQRSHYPGRVGGQQATQQGSQSPPVKMQRRPCRTLFVMVVVLVWKSTKPGAGKGRHQPLGQRVGGDFYYTISVPE